MHSYVHIYLFSFLADELSGRSWNMYLGRIFSPAFVAASSHPGKRDERNTAQRSATQRNAMQHNTQHNTTQHTQHKTTQQHNNTQYTQHNTTQHTTTHTHTQHNTTLYVLLKQSAQVWRPSSSSTLADDMQSGHIL
jgi:hypothetical protein